MPGNPGNGLRRIPVAGASGKLLALSPGEDRSGLSSAAALVLGVGIGVALGILFAPVSGEQIRRNIADSVEEFGGRIRSRVSGEADESGPEAI